MPQPQQFQPFKGESKQGGKQGKDKDLMNSKGVAVDENPNINI